MFDLAAVQSALREFGFDAWLLADFRGSNVLARRILKIADDVHTSRRFFYCLPAEGTPRKLVHRIESGVLDHLPGEKIVYLTWQELQQGLAKLVGASDARTAPSPPLGERRGEGEKMLEIPAISRAPGRTTSDAPAAEAERPTSNIEHPTSKSVSPHPPLPKAERSQHAASVAMEYSPGNAIPYIARVDAGTVELMRGLGAEVRSSGDLVQLFEACWDDVQWQSHLDSAQLTCQAFDVAWQFIADGVAHRGSVRETEVQRAIMDHFARHGLATDHPPIVGVGPHSGDPHYAPQVGRDAAMHEGDFVLVDLWAKLDRPGAVYSDYTRVGFIGREVPDKYRQIFRIVAAARDAGIDFVRQAMAAHRDLRGYEVDDATRRVIDDAGYGRYFVHRTGHSIGQETHGNGANMDNLETHDERRVLRRTCFSIEPGIYLEEFGVRSEINVFVDGDGQVHVTGEAQSEIMPILRDFTPRPAAPERSAAPIVKPAQADGKPRKKMASTSMGQTSADSRRAKAARPAAKKSKKKLARAKLAPRSKGPARPRSSGKRRSARRRP